MTSYLSATLDSKYHQVSLHPDSIIKTALENLYCSMNTWEILSFWWMRQQVSNVLWIKCWKMKNWDDKRKFWRTLMTLFKWVWHFWSMSWSSLLEWVKNYTWQNIELCNLMLSCVIGQNGSLNKTVALLWIGSVDSSTIYAVLMCNGKDDLENDEYKSFCWRLCHTNNITKSWRLLGTASYRAQRCYCHRWRQLTKQDARRKNSKVPRQLVVNPSTVIVRCYIYQAVETYFGSY